MEEVDPLLEKETNVSGVFGQSTGKIWCDIIKSKQAQVLGIYTGDYYSGRPCFTVNKFGKGHVYYLGCDLDENAMKKLALYLGNGLEIKMFPYEIEGVEAITADDEEKEVLFLLNHSDSPVVVPVQGVYREMLTGERGEDSIYLEATGVAILNFDNN